MHKIPLCSIFTIILTLGCVVFTIQAQYLSSRHERPNHSLTSTNKGNYPDAIYMMDKIL